MATPTWARHLRACAGIALAALACAPTAPPDRLAGRCAEVLDLEHLALAGIRWHVSSRRGNERTLRFEARQHGASVTDTVHCVFEDREPWRLARGVVGGRILTETEVALVNADLLLRDLSERAPPIGSTRSAS